MDTLTPIQNMTRQVVVICILLTSSKNFISLKKTYTYTKTYTKTSKQILLIINCYYQNELTHKHYSYNELTRCCYIY